MTRFPPACVLQCHSVSAWLRPLQRGACLAALAVCLLAPRAWACDGAQAVQCARANASAALQRLDALADDSQLYQHVRRTPPGDEGAPLLEMGGGAVLQDYLARQVERVRQLAAQAQEHVEVLAGTAGPEDGPDPARAQMAYWQATLYELQRYTQARDDSGQAGVLHGLMVRAARLTPANCRQALAAERSPALGKDLFSRNRRLLDVRLYQICAEAQGARWLLRYMPLAQRFNRELAGRYPFAALGARDASVPTTLDFFASYARDRSALAEVLQGYDSRCLAPQRAFLAALDQAAVFLRPVIHLEVMFSARPEVSAGSEQLIGWQLFTPHGAVSWPERSPQTLRWALGEPLTLDLRWAEQSRWRPSVDPQQPALTVEGAVASFSQQGAWALLRLMDAHGMQAADPARTLLAFRVPLRPADGVPPAPPRVALLHVALALSTMDPRTGELQPLAWPRALPRTAPQDLSGLANETCINLP